MNYFLLQTAASKSKGLIRNAAYQCYLDGELGGGMERLFYSPGHLAGPATFNISTALPTTSPKKINLVLQCLIVINTTHVLVLWICR
jgi:hypothetical protein